MHFLPYHPDDPRLATVARLDKSSYDTLLFIDFRQCQYVSVQTSLRLRTDTFSERGSSPQPVSAGLSLHQWPRQVSGSGASTGVGVRRWRIWSGSSEPKRSKRWKRLRG
eukprot:12872071-Alexandrium_andersonii.AAC.1